MRTLPVALLAVCLSSCSSGKSDPEGGGADPSARVKHRDYFATWEQRYEIVAVMSFSQAWLRSRDYPGLKGGSVIPVDDIATSRADLAERLLVECEKDFLAKHRADPKDWKETFAKDFPEAATVMHEAEVAMRELAQKQARDASGHLVLKHGDIITEAAARGRASEADERYRAYQKQYVAEHAKEWVDAAQAEARKLKGFRDLKRKVTGK